MLRETSYHNGGDAGEVQHPPATSQTEVAAYIGSMTSELQDMAQRSGMAVLSYLLSMVVLHTQEIVSGSDSISRKLR